MNQDKEHLRLLAIFHYIVAGLAALFSFFPLLYTTIGAIFIFVARHGTPKPGEELPPEFLGWIFVGLGSFLFLLGISHGDLHFDCWPMPFSPQMLLVYPRDGLHRMPVHSLWNNSRSFHYYCALARVREDVVFNSASARLKVRLSNVERRTSNAQVNGECRRRGSNPHDLAITGF